MFNLKNKVAVITGASGGLGEEMALALSKQGAKIAILDIKNAERVAKKIKTKSKYYSVDVSDEESIKQSLDSVKKDFGKIDILINNAGIYSTGPISKIKKEDWNKLMEINVTGYLLMAKHTVPKMNNGGRIINIASVAGHHAFANSAAYNASKGAVIQLTKTMAIEYSGKKITANAICPGIFKTKMTEGLLASKEVKQLVNSQVLFKRPGKANEIGGLAVYLASDESSYMTGSIITIDGGWTCHL